MSRRASDCCVRSCLLLEVQESAAATPCCTFRPNRWSSLPFLALPHRIASSLLSKPCPDSTPANSSRLASVTAHAPCCNAPAGKKVRAVCHTSCIRDGTEWETHRTLLHRRSGMQCQCAKRGLHALEKAVALSLADLYARTPMRAGRGWHVARSSVATSTDQLGRTLKNRSARSLSTSCDDSQTPTSRHRARSTT